ncbi:ABC transporter permease subunit, partial [Actinomadura adrarensis]
MGDVLDSYRLLLQGVWLTVQLTVYGGALALVFALVFGIAGTSRHRAVRVLNRVYVELFRGAPALVLMFWFYYSLPQLGIRFEALFAGVLALG